MTKKSTHDYDLKYLLRTLELLKDESEKIISLLSDTSDLSKESVMAATILKYIYQDYNNLVENKK